VTIETLPWPDPYDPGRTRGLEKDTKSLHETTDFAIVADAIYGGLFETAWWLRGFEKLIVDFYRNVEFVEFLLDRLLELFKAFYTELLRSVGDYVHVVQFGDDYAMQTGLMLSPAVFRRFIKPRLKQLYDHIHAATKAKIFHHSCGSVRALIPDLIEAGVDILNPIQLSAANMGPESLKRDFGSSICFHGGLDVQRLLPFESAENVSKEAERVAKILGARGGYIFATAHNMQAFTPPQNICVAFDSVRLGGRSWHGPAAKRGRLTGFLTTL
jgi:uroporphyrinogen decarboxylase